MDSYLTVLKTAVGEYEEKRSRFIATLCHAETEAEAVAFIEKVRSENREARHNVHAFVLNENSYSRFSDDKEPRGTAGKPVLDVINGALLKDVCIVVTRYFGGILLGTGGLCRAYTAAAKDCLQNARIVEMKLCVSFATVCDYQQFNRLQPYIEKSGGKIKSVEYTDSVTVSYTFQNELCDNYLNGLSELFGGKLTAIKTGENFTDI